MLRKQQLIQAIGELVIPLLGFFWLGWDLYFILLFYLLDLIATEVFYQLKMSRIHQFQQSKSSFFAQYSSIGLVGVIIVLSHAMLHKVYPDLVFQDAFIDFLAYEEDGIPIAQGYLLLPLIIFGNYQQYKMFFLLPNRFRTLPGELLCHSRRNALLAALAGITLITAILFFTAIPELIILLLFVAGKLWFDLKRSLI
jgi:hypothetical protein